MPMASFFYSVKRAWSAWRKLRRRDTRRSRDSKFRKANFSLGLRLSWPAAGCIFASRIICTVSMSRLSSVWQLLLADDLAYGTHESGEGVVHAPPGRGPALF